MFDVGALAARCESLDCSKSSEFSCFVFYRTFCETTNKIRVSFSSKTKKQKKTKEYDEMDLACFVNRQPLAYHHSFTIKDKHEHRHAKKKARQTEEQ